MLQRNGGWAQPSGKLRLSAAQGTVQDLALAAQKHPHPSLMLMLQPFPSPCCSHQPSACPDPVEPAELWQRQARLSLGTTVTFHSQPSAQG